MRKFDPSLYLVADAAFFRGESLIDAVEAAVRGGVTLVQLRDKSSTKVVVAERARALLDRLRPYGVPLVLNDHWDVALETRAQGVHLGQRDGDPREIRAAIGDDAILGLSIEHRGHLEAAPLDVLDYVAASPVFATTTKADVGGALGIAGVRYLRPRCPVPLIAIGGIRGENVRSLFRSGVDGIAVVSAILGAGDVTRAARELKAEIDEHFLVRPPRALTIAGSDSGGGAGIQADLKTFEALGCYGMSVITALTAQNTLEVKNVLSVSAGFIDEQLRSVVGDIGVDAIKIGMLPSGKVVEKIASTLAELVPSLRGRVVLDPVMVAKGGARLMDPVAVGVLREELLPYVALTTPNLPEAEALLGTRVSSRAEMEHAVDRLLRFTPRVVLKGGHLLGSPKASDLFADRDGNRVWFETRRTPTRNTHGTGCTFSAALAAYRALGLDWKQAALGAKVYLSGALVAGARRKLGFGHGPVKHDWRWGAGESR